MQRLMATVPAENDGRKYLAGAFALRFKDKLHLIIGVQRRCAHRGCVLRPVARGQEGVFLQHRGYIAVVNYAVISRRVFGETEVR